MKTLFSIMVLFLLSVVAQAGQGPQPKAEFQLVSYADEDTLDCHSKMLGSPFDVEVACSGANQKTRHFNVHLSFSKIGENEASKSDVWELLYWVTPLESRLDEVGTSAWFHWSQPSQPQKLQVRQFVDHGMRALELSLQF